MKKCPFCAEEIQDQAIKCKHCGEFIKEPDLLLDNDDLIYPAIIQEESPKVDDGTFKDRTQNEKKFISPKKESKYGWAWIFIAFWLSQIGRTTETSSFESRLVLDCGLLSLLIFYFWFRKKLINRISAIETWKSSFLAIIATIVLSFFLMVYVNYQESKQSVVEHGSIVNEMQQDFSVLNSKEIEIYNQIISEPVTESDFLHNIDMVNEYLLLIEKKRATFTKYTAFIERVEIERIEVEKQHEEVTRAFNNFKALGFQNIDEVEELMLYLLNYYETLDDNSFEKYETLLEQNHRTQQKFIEVSKTFMNVLE